MVTIRDKGKRKYYIDDKNKNVYITDKEGKRLYFTNDFVDISYFSKNSVSSALSNLFPYEFTFRGHQVKSIEAVLQSLKHSNPEVQSVIYNYFGKDAYHVRAASFANDWRNGHNLYCGSQLIDRFSIDYQDLLNEIYLSASKNPLLVNILKCTDNRVLLHSNGINDPEETILTPREYIDRLTIIRSSLINGMNAENSLSELGDNIASEYYQRGFIKK